MIRKSARFLSDRFCLTLLMLFTIATLTTGCTNRYLITLTNGNLITSKGKPKLNKERGVYEYKNMKGVRTYVPILRVREIEPVSWPPPKDPATELKKANEFKD